jgi:hypothetical protein
MFEAINGMLLDMLAAVARNGYDDCRRCLVPDVRARSRRVMVDLGGLAAPLIA